MGEAVGWGSWLEDGAVEAIGAQSLVEVGGSQAVAYCNT
jgi:hypothetical protein